MASGKSNNFAWELNRTLPELTKPRTDLIALFILSINDNYCIPLIWKFLDKRGNSSQLERIELVSKLLSIPNPDNRSLQLRSYSLRIYNSLSTINITYGIIQFYKHIK